MSIVEKLNKIKSCKEDIKQAIMDKGVDMSGVSLEGYATKISEIQTGGGSGDYLDIRANLSTYYSTVENVGDGAFAYCSSLQSIDLPNCISVGASAFCYCSSLQSIDLPMCASVGSNAFQFCSSLQSIDLPMCEYAGSIAFQFCKSLQSIDLPNCISVGNYTFNSCSSLQSVNLPICASVGMYAFAYCSSLQSIDLPNCIRVDNIAFQYCSSLQSVNLPICSHFGYSVFAACVSLSVLDLRSTYSCVLSNSNAFSKTPFASGVGSIYVHTTVLSQFQNATNWTYFSKCFVGVGDPTRPLLSFDSGRMYGDTYYLHNDWRTYMSVSNNSVISVDLPNCSYAVSSTFYRCSSLQSVDLPNCMSVGTSIFAYCSSLQSVNLSNCAYVGNAAFYNCSSLQSIDLPNCVSVGNYAFEYCSSLQSVNLPICESVGKDVFVYDKSLSTIYIGTSISTVCKITSTTFNQTNKTFSVFVPASLVDAYKSAQYWSEYASRIFGI